MNEHLDIKELTEVVALGIQVCDSGHLIMADGKIGFGDISELWGLLQKLGPAFENIDKVPAELSDLDIEEADAIIQMVQNDYKLESEKAKEVTIKVLKCIRSIYEVFLIIRG